MPKRVRCFDGEKYMWDGKIYDSEREGREVEREYATRGFEVRLCHDDSGVVVYTRRAVTETVVEEG